MGQSHDFWSCRDLERGMCESSSLNKVGAYPNPPQMGCECSDGQLAVNLMTCEIKVGIKKYKDMKKNLWKRAGWLNTEKWAQKRNGRFMDFHQWHWEHQWYYSEPWWTIHTPNMLPNKWHLKCGSLLRNPCPPTTASRAASKAGPGFLATTSAGVSSTSLTITFRRAGHIALVDVEKLCSSPNRDMQIHSGPVRPFNLWTYY